MEIETRRTDDPVKNGVHCEHYISYRGMYEDVYEPWDYGECQKEGYIALCGLDWVCDHFEKRKS